MNIVFDSYDDDRGTWVQVGEFPRPYTESPRKFLWWEWTGRDYIHHQEWLIAAVRQAKEMWGRGNMKTLRVRYLNSTIWRDGQWKCDSKDYEWIFGIRDLA